MNPPALEQIRLLLDNSPETSNLLYDIRRIIDKDLLENSEKTTLETDVEKAVNFLNVCLNMVGELYGECNDLDDYPNDTEEKLRSIQESLSEGIGYLETFE